MYRSVYDLKDFYNCPAGAMIAGTLRQHIRNWWPDVRSLKIAGIGYAQPYLDMFLGSADRCFAVNPAGQGACPWPEGEKNLTVLAEEAELPFETNSLDRVLLIHSLEYAELPKANLQEIWRVLKSNGRLLIVTPNRLGFWARADWSPYGEGTPYSLTQLRWALRENLFVFERSKPALFALPLRWHWLLRIAPYFEKFCPYIFPAFSGLHMIEASKQLYAGTPVGEPSRVRIRGRAKLATEPIPTPRKKLSL
jgi:SAM-dependent methyltransferase